MNRMPAITSFVMFIALCVSAAYWGMQLFNPPMRPVAAPPQSIQPIPSLDAAANLFGGHATAVVASNYRLTGVVMASKPADSVAILVANGKKPQAVRANAEVAPGVTVKEVRRDHVLLSEGGATKRVDLPKQTQHSRQATMPDNNPAIPVEMPKATPLGQNSFGSGSLPRRLESPMEVRQR